MSVYDEIGIRRVLNASGSMTYLGGSLIAPDVVEKMGEAARSFIVMEELVEWACGEVARLTGTEAALVTTGTAGGILLATAAVLTGRDRQKMRSLPTVGPKCEILVQMPHRIGFDHAIGVAGGSLVEVGGPQGATREQLAAAIGPNPIKNACPSTLRILGNCSAPLDVATIIEKTIAPPTLTIFLFLQQKSMDSTSTDSMLTRRLGRSQAPSSPGRPTTSDPYK